MQKQNLIQRGEVSRHARRGLQEVDGLWSSEVTLHNHAQSRISQAVPFVPHSGCNIATVNFLARKGLNMAISISEQLIPIRAVPSLLPPRENGHSIHVSALYRWVQRGIKGNRLEIIQIGGTTYTSREALQRFGEILTQRPEEHRANLIAYSKTRQRQIEQAERHLDELFAPKGRASKPSSVVETSRWKSNR